MYSASLKSFIKSVLFQLVDQEWTAVWQSRVHTHDIRAILFVRDFVITGSVDASLYISQCVDPLRKALPSQRIRQWKRCIDFCPAKRWFVHADTHFARVWQLAKSILFFFLSGEKLMMT